MDPFVQHLAELYRAHVTRAKWVFVPTHAAQVMRLFLEPPPVGVDFCLLANQPRIAKALWTALQVLRMAGVKVDEPNADRRLNWSGYPVLASKGTS